MKSLDFLYYNSCTNDQWFGCERQGTPTHIINPVRSARVRTINSFSFKYGKLEVIAKMPTGDWLWPGKKFYTKDTTIKIFFFVVYSYMASTNQ